MHISFLLPLLSCSVEMTSALLSVIEHFALITCSPLSNVWSHPGGGQSEDDVSSLPSLFSLTSYPSPGWSEGALAASLAPLEVAATLRRPPPGEKAAQLTGLYGLFLRDRMKLHTDDVYIRAWH